MSSATTLLLQTLLSVALIGLGLFVRKPLWRRTRNRWVSRLPAIVAAIVVAIVFAWSFGLFSNASCDATADPDSCGTVALPSPG